MTRLLQACTIEALIPSSQKFTLEFMIGAYNQHELHVVPTQIEVNCKTAATSALIYASWWGDLELVKMIVQDLGEIIDINTTIGDKGVLEWAIEHMKDRKEPSTVFGAIAHNIRENTAASICRFLINHYGSKIDANSPKGAVLKTFAWPDTADIVAKLVKTCSTNLVNPRGTGWIFEVLIKGGYEDEAEMLLNLNQAQLSGGSHLDVLAPAIHYGSARVFKTTMDLFGSQANIDEVNQIFKVLCKGDKWRGSSIADAYPKIRTALDMWANQLTPSSLLPDSRYHPLFNREALSSLLTPDTVEYCLVHQWIIGKDKRETQGLDAVRDHGLAAQLIVERCQEQLHEDSIQIALTTCCWPRNIELFDAIFDSNFESIRAEPLLMHHAFVESASLGDDDMRRYIMEKCETHGIPTFKSNRHTTKHNLTRIGRRKRLTLDVQSKLPLVYTCDVKWFYGILY